MTTPVRTVIIGTYLLAMAHLWLSAVILTGRLWSGYLHITLESEDFPEPQRVNKNCSERLKCHRGYNPAATLTYQLMIQQKPGSATSHDTLYCLLPDVCSENVTAHKDVFTWLLQLATKPQQFKDLGFAARTTTPKCHHRVSDPHDWI